MGNQEPVHRFPVFVTPAAAQIAKTCGLVDFSLSQSPNFTTESAISKTQRSWEEMITVLPSFSFCI